MCAVNQVCRSLVISPVRFLCPHILPDAEVLSDTARLFRPAAAPGVYRNAWHFLSSVPALRLHADTRGVWRVSALRQGSDSLNASNTAWLSPRYLPLNQEESVRVCGSWSTALDELRYWKIYHRSYLRVVLRTNHHFTFYGVLWAWLNVNAGCGHFLLIKVYQQNENQWSL